MATLTKQVALLRETAEMALDTLRSNKMRSALTVLGVVIGVTSIVGMTSLIRGFDTSLRESINSMGPNTIFVQRFGGLSFASGASFTDLMRRPLVTTDDMFAIQRQATTIGMFDPMVKTVWKAVAATPVARYQKRNEEGPRRCSTLSP